mmetsp:Transcript_64297/g.170313  ORF Transcript_64297/g.170313 Transcript_64297/m.170313 type:complete len:111 (+) Transcript_64297:2658-2990(+)
MFNSSGSSSPEAYQRQHYCGYVMCATFLKVAADRVFCCQACCVLGVPCFTPEQFQVALCTCADVDGGVGRRVERLLEIFEEVCWPHLVFARAVEVSKKMLLLSCMLVNGH